MDYVAHRLYVVDYYNHAVRLIHMIETTGSNEINNVYSFKIYPNPARKRIYISGNEMKSDLIIRIFNRMGNIVIELQV